MRMIRLSILVIFMLLVLNVSVGPLFATAPMTPKILFTSARDGNREIYIMNPDGTEQMKLTQHPANDLNAVWSPTGKQILVSDRGGKRDLYLMDPDGTNVRRVFKREVKGITYRDYPTWSPDGKQIAYMHTHWDDNKFLSTLRPLENKKKRNSQDHGGLSSNMVAGWSRNSLRCSKLPPYINQRPHTKAKTPSTEENAGWTNEAILVRCRGQTRLLLE